MPHYKTYIPCQSKSQFNNNNQIYNKITLHKTPFFINDPRVSE
jgi:hypothetical protein